MTLTIIDWTAVVLLFVLAVLSFVKRPAHLRKTSILMSIRLTKDQTLILADDAGRPIVGVRLAGPETIVMTATRAELAFASVGQFAAVGPSRTTCPHVLRAPLPVDLRRLGLRESWCAACHDYLTEIPNVGTT